MTVFAQRGYRCLNKSCDKPFYASTPENCPVDEYVQFAKSLTCPHCSSNRVGLGISLTPEENQDLIVLGSIQTRAENWLENGERGLSADTIHKFFSGDKNDHPAHPHDIDDLKRCVYLLQHIPEWQTRMHKMAKLSPVWSRLAPAWNELTDLYASEAIGSREMPKTYALLQSLIS